MNDQQTGDACLRKAQESLESAESEYANRRYNSCANRCYYACFQAAIAALLAAGIGPREPGGRWRHEYLQATFDGQLIRRRKRYPGSLSGVLSGHHRLRLVADYGPRPVTQKQADRALRRSRDFVGAIRQGDST